jgi:hypothetical protein
MLYQLLKNQRCMLILSALSIKETREKTNESPL